MMQRLTIPSVRIYCNRQLSKSFHMSQIVMAKKNNKSDAATTSDEPVPELPKLKDVDARMQFKLAILGDEFSRMKGGKASTDMLNHVTVSAYGSKIPIPEAGQVSIKSPTKMEVAVFDPELVSSVSAAIRDCGMNLNPTIEGNVIAIIIPKSSKESRDLLMKAASKTSEKEIRQVRKEFMDDLKKVKSSFSEDDSRRFIKEVDALTEKIVEQITKLQKDKEHDLSSA